MKFPEKWLRGDSLGERITSELRLEIISGHIPRDTVLTENQISAQFGTSRSPVREAFKTLATEGLVDLQRMGAVVLGLTKQDIDELYDVRFLLENFALQRIADNFDEKKALKFYRILDMMELLSNHDDHLEFSYYDLLFHESIILETNHKRISHFWNNIRHIVLCLLIVATEKRFLEDKIEVKNLIEAHRSIIQALLSKDKDMIHNLVEQHFEDTKQTVGEAYLPHIYKV
ncbi:GntR family transcriptional regulator [Bacillus sp. FJAT-50079]|uniref:GntR family transcriptional regulator n=1 Tax=Bacillus sp. FJAT-50079 TaxID=2833577 RepID=UPI001BC8E620|nr:GntR family transcriptional regulator [Bacillus sp. FJAT-50079]MBS4208143.1 GntR family transcriptional regulator [Bacillus sp. FJAT-50079]